MKRNTSTTSDRAGTSKEEDNLPDISALAHSDNGIASVSLDEDLKKINEKKLKSDLVAWMKSNYAQMRDDMESLKRQWYLNMAFYNGKQYADIVDNKFFKDIPAPAKRVRLVINRIKPAVRTEIARLTSQDPTAEVVPATSDQSDINAAKAAHQVYLSSSETKNLKTKVVNTTFWSALCGVGYMKTTWNPGIKNEYPDGQVAMGDLEFTPLSPFHVLVPDITAIDIEDQPYVFNVFTRPLGWVKERWGDVIPKDHSPSHIGMTEIMDESHLNVDSGQKKKADSCLVIEAWFKPGGCKHLPQGGMVTLVDDFIVQFSDKGMPYAHGEYPFAKLESVPSGTYYTTSMVEDLIPPQRELNRVRSQMVEARNKMANPGYLFDKGSIDPNKFTNQVAQMVEVMPGMRTPTPLQMPEIPGYVQNEQEWLLRDIEDISGQHQVSKGNTPAGVTAATAIQFLQEQDNSYMSTAFDSMAAFQKKIGKHIIQLFIQYADSERLIKVTGKNGAVDAQWLRGSDIRSGTDLRIEDGSGLPQSKAARVAMFMDMMSRGLIPAEMGLELMNLPHMNDYWEITKIDQNQAQRENVQLANQDPEQFIQDRALREQQKQAMLMQMGFMPGDEMENPEAAMIASQFDAPILRVNDFDNHEVHIEEHNRFRKSQEFETLDPVLQEEMGRHVAAHEQAMQQKLLEQAFFQNGGAPNPEQAMMEQMAMGDPNADPNAPVEESGEGAGNQFSDIPTNPDAAVDTTQPV